MKNINKYNIYEAFLYTFKKFILVLSYTPGFNIDFIIGDMLETFNLKLIKLEGPTDLKEDSVFNYDKLNNDVLQFLEQNKDVNSTTTTYGTGILITGLNFPPKLLKFQTDLHLHFSLSSNLYLKTIPNSKIEDYNTFKIILGNNIINKYFNIKSEKSIEINNSVFDKIIDYFEFKVYGKEYNIYSTMAKSTPVKMPQPEQKNQKYTSEEIDNVTTDAALSAAEANDNRFFIITDSYESPHINFNTDDSPFEL